MIEVLCDKTKMSYIWVYIKSSPTMAKTEGGRFYSGAKAMVSEWLPRTRIVLLYLVAPESYSWKVEKKSTFEWG